MRPVLVPPARLERWLRNFAQSHGEPTLRVSDGALCGVAPDGSTFAASLPFGRRYGGAPGLAPFLAEADPPASWGVLLVRKGGFAVARLAGADLVTHKVGQRHVQGRAKAGGWSQQRFARRRDHQARAAYDAAAGHAREVLLGTPSSAPWSGRRETSGGPLVLVTGGDRAALDAVLSDPALAALDRVPYVLDTPEPRRVELDRAIEQACSVRMIVTNA